MNDNIGITGENTAHEATVQQILDVVGKGDFRDLIGIVETETVEFKGAIYPLTTVRDKLELAKDVSALANSGGGILLMGVGTTKLEDRPHEVADQIRAFEETRLDIRQYEDIIAQNVYPNPDAEIKWCPSVADTNKGVAYIRVPEPRAGQKPFLVRGILSEGDKLLGNVVGFFERKGDRVLHWSAERLHHTFEDGLRFDQHLAEIREGMEKILSSNKNERHSGIAREILDRRVENAIDVVGCEGDTSYTLLAYPDIPIEIKGLFDGPDSDLVKLIDRPPELRYSGFDICAGEPSRIIKGESRRAVVKSYKLLEVWRDGTLISVSSGAEGFLCWGNYNADEFLKINATALVESVYLFCAFAKKLLEIGAPQDCQIQLEISIRDIPPDKKYLLPKSTPRTSYFRPTNSGTISESSFTIRKKWKWRTELPERVAYELVGEFYARFGLGHDLIPFVAGQGGDRIIDVEQIKELG